MTTATAFTMDLRDVDLTLLPLVGGKNASLGEMIRRLESAGVRVPGGFALTAEAFRLHIRENALDWIYDKLGTLDVQDTRALAKMGGDIRRAVDEAPLPAAVLHEVLERYHALSQSVDPTGAADVPVAVRSSATAEDLPNASFAGQHETYLNVCGARTLDRAIRACMASLFTDRAISYRVNNGFSHRDVALSVGVQRMVRSDEGANGCAGTMFTLDTESGNRDVVIIDGSWGLGEAIVQGRVTPDEFWVHKPTASAGFQSIIRRRCGEKAIKLVYADASSLTALPELRAADVSTADRTRLCLSDDEVLQLARWAMAIEQHYAARADGRGAAMDVEWAKDGRTNQLYILQARPETVHSQRTAASIESFHLREKRSALVTGRAVGTRIGSGVVRVVRSPSELAVFQPGEVLVASMTDPDWEPVLRRAVAVVTDRGGRTCHAAIVAREIGVPCVVGTTNATTLMKDGDRVTVSCAEGDVGSVYPGYLRFDRTTMDPSSMPESRVPVMLNIADPSRAFGLARLPVAGVGLLRIEFMVSNWIGVHPMALVHPERVTDVAAREEISRRTAGFASPPEFFVSRLAEGVAQIAAAFYPRPVIVRLSDFKTNEYAGLLGGSPFEPHEENPMLGFRGASRYYHDAYREGFALECAAIRRVRQQMGLTNVIVMIPFCRTLGEAQAVITEMEKHGLRRTDGFKVFVMCEIPNNVILADRFSDLFDGFSIGSNDLTQLTLGVDRDSAILADLFDEHDPGVKALIQTVITKAHAKGRPVGICGEAPSNDPEFARWLADIGIDSISVNPDSLPAVAHHLTRD